MSNSNMADIAKAAGVSIATVGRVIHNNGYVSEEARRRVEEAVSQFGYVPNSLARALRTNKSGVIGSLVVYNMNNLYQKINVSVIAAAEARGYELLTIEGRQGRRDEERIIRRFIGMRVDAIVITSNLDVPKYLFEQLHSLSIPVVAIERTYDERYVDNVAVLDLEGAREAVGKMVARGHRRIALIAKELCDSVEIGRYGGYRAALEAGGIEIDESLIRLIPGYFREHGREAMRSLMALSDPPTAVFVTADMVAAGAMQHLYERGIRIPDGMSIAGYDNVLAASLSPAIDSVDFAAKDIGGTVMDLIARRQADNDAPSATRRVGTVYVDRGTVRRI